LSSLFPKIFFGVSLTFYSVVIVITELLPDLFPVWKSFFLVFLFGSTIYNFNHSRFIPDVKIILFAVSERFRYPLEKH